MNREEARDYLRDMAKEQTMAPHDFDTLVSVIVDGKWTDGWRYDPEMDEVVVAGGLSAVTGNTSPTIRISRGSE